MFDPIQANYTQDGEKWKVEVSCLGKTHKATANSLLAARDRADKLAVKLMTDDDKPHTIVHTLDGDAVAFTAAYLNARLGMDAVTASEAPAAAARTS